jgi:hypothetical protein
MSIIQRALYEQLHSRFAANSRRVAALARPLDPERLVRRPPSGGWSVGEVLEHLCVIDESYAAPTSNLIRSARADAAAPLREWKPTLLGKALAGMLERPAPLKAPKRFVPLGSPRGGVVEEFLTRSAELAALMETASNLDWRALRMSPPNLPRLFKVNLGDVFRMNAVHVERHLGQMERVVAAIG